MKILWHSNAPWANTGYGQQTATFTPRLAAAGHDVAISAFWGLGGSPLNWEGMTVYPADERWGNRTLPVLADRHAPDGDSLVITLMDVWVLTNPNLRELNLASWVPVDHAPLPPKVHAFFANTGATPIAMSRFGERMLREAGHTPLYVPHGIDTSVFRPRLDMRAQVREVMGIPQDAFVIGMNAANKGALPPRKAFPQVFQAFKRLRDERDDVYLYLHTELSGAHEGVNLGALAAAVGLSTDAVKYTPPSKYELGATAEELACLYSALDALANPSYGEGFGIPIIEAQACGTPVIVNDFSAMPELCGAGWLVGGEPYYNASQGSFYQSPSITELHDAMRAAYDARGDQQLRDQAREFALAYDADHVMAEHWTPGLQRLEHKPATLQPLEAA